MVNPKWIDKDFYNDLGVSSTASADEIRKAYRKLARELHPDANPGDKEAEERFKAVSEAHDVLSDPEQRKEYDETRRLASSGAFSGGSPGGTGNGGFSSGGFDFGDVFGGGAGAGDSGLGDFLGGFFGRGGGAGTGGTRTATRPRGGSDVETEMSLDFREATLGATVPIRLKTRSACTNCHGSGARPGTSPRVCPKCNGTGMLRRNQGAFGFSEPCDMCSGTGSLIDDPCPVCSGSGVLDRERTISVRVPAGVTDGQRIRLAGQGEAGLRGAPAGDLFVTTHVRPDAVFGRDGANITVTVPVSFGELALGATVSVPTLDGRVGLKVPAGTPDGRVFRVGGQGVPGSGSKGSGSRGDLLVTVKVAVPKSLDEASTAALSAYAEAERASGFDPRSGWAGAK